MTHFNATEYGKRVKELREEKHMTQIKLAEVLGYSDARQIQRIEAGELIITNNLKRVSSINV